MTKPGEAKAAERTDGGEDLTMSKKGSQSRRHGSLTRGGRIGRIMKLALLGILALALTGIGGAYVAFRRDLAAARSRLAHIPTKVYASSAGTSSTCSSVRGRRCWSRMA